VNIRENDKYASEP